MTNFAAFPYMGQFGYGTPPFAPPGTPDPQQGSGTFPQLPSPPPHGGMGLSGSTATASANLPAPPPRKRGQLFDKDHRQETLLAIAAGFGSGSNFGEGASNMARNLLALKQGIRAEDRKDNTFGGPDNAFEITTDPTTGARTVREVPEFAGYLEKKRLKAKDVADINGRAMWSLAQLPEDQRPAAYATMIANPGQYGIDPSTMPARYDANYVNMASKMGMTVAQAQRDQRAGEAAGNLEDWRAGQAADREVRTAAYLARLIAMTHQGDERLSLARGRDARAALGPKKPKVAPGNLDLSYLLK